jgi:hypothetical protein
MMGDRLKKSDGSYWHPTQEIETDLPFDRLKKII